MSSAFAVTKIGFRLGIIPGASRTRRFTRLVGVSKAKGLIFTARTLTRDGSPSSRLRRGSYETGTFDAADVKDRTALGRGLQLVGEIPVNGLLAARAAKPAISRAMEFPL